MKILYFEDFSEKEWKELKDGNKKEKNGNAKEVPNFGGKKDHQAPASDVLNNFFTASTTNTKLKK